MAAPSIRLRITVLFLVLAAAPVALVLLAPEPYRTPAFREAGAAFPGAPAGASPDLVVHALRGQAQGELPGRACTPAGDVDGDGADDLWLLTAAARAGDAGGLVLVSGATGESLRAVPIQRRGRTAVAIAPIADLDGDGRPELAVALASIHGAFSAMAYPVPLVHGISTLGRFEELVLVSGASGAILEELVSGGQGASFEDFVAVDGPAGSRLVVATRDEVVVLEPPSFARRALPAGASPVGPALLAAVPDFDGAGTAAVALARGTDVRVQELASGRELLALAPLEEAPASGPPASAESIAVPAFVPDQDGDGHADLLVGYPQAEGMAGRARLFSGASGALLWEQKGAADSVFGYLVTAVGDLDGDGVAELAIGAPGREWLSQAMVSALAWGVRLPAPTGTGPAGELALLRGGSFEPLASLRGDSPRSGFASSAGAASDLDGDGRVDLVVEERALAGHDPARGSWSGTSWVFSGAALAGR